MPSLSKLFLLVERIPWSMFDKKLLLFKADGHLLYFNNRINNHTTVLVTKLFYRINKTCDITACMILRCY